MTFLKFLKLNLAEQTSVRIDPHWASQSAILRGFGDLAFPDMVIREEEMAAYLPALAMQVGIEDAPEPQDAPEDEPFALSDVYNEEIETLAADAYQRDYLMFGFSSWR